MTAATLEAPGTDTRLVQVNQVEEDIEKPIFSGYEIGRVTQRDIPLVQVNLSIQEIEDIYDKYKNLDFLPVADGEQVVGYMMRDVLKAKLGENQYSRALHTRPGRTIKRIMEKRVAVLDCRMPLNQASEKLMARDEEVLYHPTVVTRHGKYWGICTLRNVLNGINYYNTIDVNSCKEAQRNALEMPALTSNRIEYASILKQIDNLGGDFTYFFEISSDLHFFMLGDVSGKGLKASNMVLSIITAIDTTLALVKKKLKKFEKTPNITNLLKKLNKVIMRSTPSDMYATVACFFVDLRHNLVQFFDFAHTTVFIKRGRLVIEVPKSPLTQELPPFIGMTRELDIKPLVLRIRPGDIIYAYSDGLSEAKNPKKDEFGEERVVEILKERSDTSPEELIQDTLKRLEIFRDGYRQTDDLSIMAVKIKE